MELNNIEYTTGTAEDGRQIITETDATYTHTSEDGTVSVAEIVTTSSPDDPTDVVSHMTVTQTNPDGTVTEYEAIANEDGAFLVEEESLGEQIVEAVFDVEIPDELTPVSTDGVDNTDNDSVGFGQDNNGGDIYGNNFQSYDANNGGTAFDSSYQPATNYGTTDTTTASDYLYTDTSFDVQPVETSVTAEDVAYNQQYNADYADYYQDQADIAQNTAMDYAEHGDYDAANVYAESAETHQTAADEWTGMEQ